ncbi:condensin-2 complex subunit H2 isoform X2 [Tripterygium wilfordii]|uniref:Condensin-2 complex subunit H2 n=1 Tax=Tripterygium wilfordii TaxID=458696 RepID=A0A7J7CXC9_TRIWF|nr:condensin-2 complex subunit H2 isoform X2 [Tripterygium wilfordii]
MNNRGEETGNGGRGGFHTVQAELDLGANWGVDLTKKLEEYLLKICSGEITRSEEDDHFSVNFAEAALLLQGSTQVYSRKVEYLYNLVLHDLEFLSQKRQQEQESTSVQNEESGSCVAPEEQNDLFWGLDDIPVVARNCLDSSKSKDISLNHFVKPPANLVVLEGDCLDTTCDGGELELYLLATNDLYRDFILLDPCDAVTVDNFLKGDASIKRQNNAYRGSSVSKNFQSPTRRSGGTTHKSSIRTNQDANINRSVAVCRGFENTSDNFEYGDLEIDINDRYSDPGELDASDADDDDDLWKPLNPYEPGNLKVKPFRKAKASRRNGMNSTARSSLSTLFPLARMNGTISPELTEMWEKQCNALEKEKKLHSSSLYEKLRLSLANGGSNPCDTFTNPENDNEDHAYDDDVPDLGEPDFDMPEYMDEDVPLYHDRNDGSACFDTNEAYGDGVPNSQASLEDLCRSHLDALRASIAENEKQTELAVRVSSWKQKIEHNLEEQDSHPPFDIHAYGERILSSLEGDNAMSFSDIVKGQEKHDVARTFSALLQLVNNGDVAMDRSRVDGESICYTAVNPFHIKLLKHNKAREEARFHLSRKRVKSPPSKGLKKANKDKPMIERSPTSNSSLAYGLAPKTQPNCKFTVKPGKVGGMRCTPDGKRRRRSRFVKPVDINSAG